MCAIRLLHSFKRVKLGVVAHTVSLSRWISEIESCNPAVTTERPSPPLKSKQTTKLRTNYLGPDCSFYMTDLLEAKYLGQ